VGPDAIRRAVANRAGRVGKTIGKRVGNPLQVRNLPR